MPDDCSLFDRRAERKGLIPGWQPLDAASGGGFCAASPASAPKRHQVRRFAAISSTQLPSPERYRGANEPRLGP